jgi:hypothetical protein
LAAPETSTESMAATAGKKGLLEHLFIAHPYSIDYRRPYGHGASCNDPQHALWKAGWSLIANRLTYGTNGASEADLLTVNAQSAIRFGSGSSISRAGLGLGAKRHSHDGRAARQVVTGRYRNG